jgi:hypothetical protein
MEQEFRLTWRRLDVSFDDFIPHHRSAPPDRCHRLARRIYDAGDIYEGSTKAGTCVGCEEFKQDKDLVDGHCPLHPTLKPEWIREKNHFSASRSISNRCWTTLPRTRSFSSREPAQPRSFGSSRADCRTSPSAAPGNRGAFRSPFDPSSVVYVWLDALINYASAVAWARIRICSRWWPADLHVIGDITRFHAVIWPAMLMSAKIALPRQIFGHGFMTMNGQRMSKTLGTIVDPIVAADRLGPQGQDPLRLYLVKEVSFGGDGDFTWERYDERYNVDLANNLGNLVSRVAAMAGRYRNGRLTAARGLGSAGTRGRAGRRRLSPIDGRLCAARRRGGGVSPDRRDQRVHRRDSAVDAREGSGTGGSADPRAVRRGGSNPAGGGAARADHADILPRDPAACRDNRDRTQFRPRRPMAERRRASARAGRTAVAAARTKGDDDGDRQRIDSGRCACYSSTEHHPTEHHRTEHHRNWHLSTWHHRT